MTAKPLSPTELKRLHRTWRRRGELRLAVVLDGVQNPFNVGAILRSAAAYGASTVWAAPPTPGLDHAGVAKTALGSHRFVTWVDVASGADGVAAAADAGYRTVAVELTADATPLFELDLAGPVCLVLGHEDRGVHRDTLGAVDAVGFLPLVGKIGSLNVAHAATAALAEVARQAWSPST